MTVEEMARRLRYSTIRALRSADWGPALDAALFIAQRHAADEGIDLSEDAREALEADLEGLVGKTGEVTDPLEQSKLISGLVAGAISTFVALQAGPDRVKTWVTSADDRVRPSHAAQHGVTVDIGDHFTVGEARMSGPHDPTAPIDELAGCRCWLQVEKADSLAAAGPPPEETFIVALLPEADDLVNAATSEQVPHVTVLYLPKGAEDAARAAIEALPPLEPAVVEVKNVGELGDEGATVAFLDRDALIDIREALLTPEVQDALGQVEQFPDWTPHLTLGYPETPPPDAELPPAITLDRLALVDETVIDEYPLEGADMDEDETTETILEDEDDVQPPLFDEQVPFHGVAAVEGIPTGDLRKFARGALTWQLPMDLAWCKVDGGAHDGAIVTGRLTNMWRDGDLIKYEGFFSSSEEAGELIGFLAEGSYSGVSVDVDDSFEVTFENREGQPVDPDSMLDEQVVTTFNSGRVRGLTVVRIPAFAEAWIAPGPWDEEVAEEPAPPTDEAIAAAAQLDEAEPGAPLEEVQSFRSDGAEFADVAPGVTEDGPGWLTHPVDTDRLRDYWVRGPGAAKIGWGLPGDFNRCRMNLAEYIKPQHLAGYCANRHKDALGIWPGQHHSGVARELGGISIVASGRPEVLPAGWFQDPELPGPSAVVVTEDGRVYGHLATWGTCHIGIPGSCVTPPESPSRYAYFRTGAVLTDGGEVPVGQITMGTGHATLSSRAPRAIAHYDNTGYAVADVAAGEDEHGIWIAGAVRPGATEEQIAALRGSALSGDWRRIAGGMELVAALAVNTPGFPIPRVALAASAGEQEALVASGIVEPQRPIEETIDEIVERTFERREAKAALATMARDFRVREIQSIKAKVN